MVGFINMSAIGSPW